MAEATEIRGRALGGLKTAAKRIGIAFDAYMAHRAAGERWCTSCREWHAIKAFGSDANRHEGIASACLDSRHTGKPVGWHEKPNINPMTGRPGPAPSVARDGDKVQARHRVNLEVRGGRIPAPNDLPCHDCEHVFSDGERRHEYDHYRGYSAEHHLSVQPVCTQCHCARGWARGEIDAERLASGGQARAAIRKTHCALNHSMERCRDGKWRCMECRRAYWRARGKKAAGRLLDGRTHDEFPEVRHG